MAELGTICAVCAWRGDCKKKFLISGSDMRCADFVKDVAIKDKDHQKNRSSEK